MHKTLFFASGNEILDLLQIVVNCSLWLKTLTYLRVAYITRLKLFIVAEKFQRWSIQKTNNKYGMFIYLN